MIYLFGENVISKKSAFPWSPRSPDLSSLDFYLWRYCKDNVYHNNPQNVIELQRIIFIGKIFQGRYANVSLKTLSAGWLSAFADKEIILNTAYNCMELSESSQILCLFSRLVYLNMLFRLKMIKV